MNRRWMLGCGGAAAVVLVLLAIPVALVGSAFVGNVELVDRNALANGRVSTVFDTYVGCFLVDTSEGYVLVDGCMGPDPVEAALAELGASKDDVRLILLTHSHEDHVGVAREWSDIPVRALAAEIPRLEGREAHEGPIPSMMGAADTGVRVTEPLVDGEVIQMGDTAIEVFALPGHTAGSAAFLAHGVLFMGDSAGWKTDGIIVPAPWVFSDDVAENEASLRALARRLEPRADEIEWIQPGHTGPAPGLEPLLTY